MYLLHLFTGRMRMESTCSILFCAAEPKSPVVLLLHGFPASSFMFRDLIPWLARRLSSDRFPPSRVSDLPKFPRNENTSIRSTVWPRRSTRSLSFGKIADALRCMCSTTARQRDSVWRWLTPDRVTAIISQNGNA